MVVHVNKKKIKNREIFTTITPVTYNSLVWPLCEILCTLLWPHMIQCVSFGNSPLQRQIVIDTQMKWLLILFIFLLYDRNTM